MDIYKKVVQVLTQNLTPDELVAFFERYDGGTLDFHEALAKATFAVRPGLFAKADTLDTLSGEFDAMLDRMQAPERQAAMLKAFGASAEELGGAAVAGAKKRKEAGRNRTKEWMEWIYHNPKELAKYTGKHVAIDSVLGVIDADESADALYNRIQAQGRLGDVVFDTVL